MLEFSCNRFNTRLYIALRGSVVMIDKLLSGTTAMEKSLDAAWSRNEIISQNIANVDTPGYKRKDIAFEEYLSNSKKRIAGNRTDVRHIPISSSDIDSVDPTMTQDYSELSMRIDGNNVDIDTEMANLAKNSIKFNALTQMLNGSFSKIKSVISEGRK